MTDLQARPRFYEGQYLDAADLTAAVDYSKERTGRMLLGAHRWGIAIGLDLAEVPRPDGTVDVVVRPGYAWDGFGRPIVVAEQVKVPIALFSNVDGLHVGGAPPPPQLVALWIRYEETAFQGPRPGFEGCGPAESALSRVQERFALEAGPRDSVASRRDPVTIAGRVMDAADALRPVTDPSAPVDPSPPRLVDASVPHQDLSAVGATARWLIPLGIVSYQPGSPGHFVARDVDAKGLSGRSREYIGAVVGSLEAAGGVVRVHDRMKPYSPVVTGELLTVEGDIRADGDIRLFGGRLEFPESLNENPRAPFHMKRTSANGWSSLTVVIGDKTDGKNSLVVGPRTKADPAGDTYAPRLVVTDKGPVGIGVAAPTALLHLAETGVQIGDSATAEDNFHIQSNTDGPRALRFYNKNVGAGTPLASLTSTGMLGIGETSPQHPLHIKGVLGIRQNSMYLNGDLNWSSLTFNAHHNPGNTDWVFPDPSKPAATIEMDASPGYPRFDVYTTVAGNNRFWSSRLRVNGHTGDVAVGHNGGSLGVGTDHPSARLDVQGDVAVTGDVRIRGMSAITSGSRLRVVWGAVSAAGVDVGGEGYTSKRTAAGRYEVQFTSAFLGQPIVIVSRVFGNITVVANDPSGGETAEVDFVSPANVVVTTAGEAGTPREDGAFTFIAIGPRF